MAVLETDDTLNAVAHPFLPGVIARADNPDELYKLLSLCKEQKTALRHVELLCRELLGQMAAGDKQTRRLGLENNQMLKLEFDGPSWSQSVIKQLVAEDPQQCFGVNGAEVIGRLTKPPKDGPPCYLRITQFAPNIREVNKLRSMTGGNERALAFREKLLAAESPNTSPPRVSLEGE